MSKTAGRVREAFFRRGSFIILLILILGAVGLLRIVTTHEEVTDVANIDLPLIEILTQVETDQLEQAINFERALRYAKNIEDSENDLKGFSLADSTFRHLAKKVDLGLMDAENKVKSALLKTQQESHKITLRGLLLAIKKLENDHASYEKQAFLVLDGFKKGKEKQAESFIERVEEEESRFNAQVEGVLVRHEMFTETVAQVIEQREVMSMKWIISITLIFIIIALVAVYAFSYRMWKPLEEIRLGAVELGSGNLDTRLKLKSSNITGEIVEAFNQMADHLEQSNNEINQFIQFSYSSANDLKAPISNVHSLLNMLGNDKLGASNFVTILNNAKKSTSKLEETVNALAEVNKIRENLRTEQKTIVFFDDVLKESLLELKSEMKDTKVSIKRDFSEASSILYSYNSLKSIFKTLISNSVKYKSPERPLVITIKTKQYQNNGEKALLVFRDNGLGFDYIKHQNNIFNPFVRLHKHTEGSGLGLYMIKMIINYYKGAIKVDSQEKKGTTFTVNF